MDQSLARHEALRVFRWVLVVQLGFLVLSFVAVWGLAGSARFGIFVRAAPTLLLALLVLPPWLEQVLGRYFLALALGWSLFFASLETAYLFVDWPVSRIAELGLPPEVVEQIAAAPPIEPFFFLLIPLVLLAWGYGRRGALLGSTWAALLHLGLGVWLSSQSGFAHLLVPQALARIALLYLVPLIVSVLAERERYQHARLEAAHQRLRRHAATIEQLAISRERNRLARNLHDTLAHSLSALAVQLEALRSLMTNDPEAAPELVDRLLIVARRGLEGSRGAIQALRAEPVETLGLVGVLRDMVHAFQARTGVQSSFSLVGSDPDLTVEEAQVLFRIAEEALSNVERHANAKQVTVNLTCGSDRVDLVIQDDGLGFELNTIEADRYGVTGMRERAAMVGAFLTVDSRPGGGTEVWCSLQRG